jgi:hypothetical protein
MGFIFKGSMISDLESCGASDAIQRPELEERADLNGVSVGYSPVDREPEISVLWIRKKGFKS